MWFDTAPLTRHGQNGNQHAIKITTPGVKQSRASQWRARVSRRLGASADMVNCDYG